ncbi:MAG: aldehyde dehydrogenase family protein [Acidimicrobiia bacterium]|nr:aldehyde dehydrogenase family protein [Acidimicrobiia bacterium]
MIEHHEVYVDGAWVTPAGAGSIDVHDAATGDVMATVPECAAAIVDDAVAAAAAASGAWSATAAADRAKYVQAIAEGIEARATELAATISREVGMPIALAGPIQVGLSVTHARAMVELAATFPWEERIANSVVVREPIGVVGAIAPWNYPLNQIAVKVFPALLAGNTVVVKPSEVAPLSAFALAEIVDAAGLGAGVFNLVSGYGPVVGEALAAHPAVDMVSFTGSTRAGKRVAEVASATAKKVALEMGGKSACILLDDADFPKAVKAAVNNAYLNGGQTCSAWTRLLVPETRRDEAVELARRAAESFTVGDPGEPGVKLGPMVSAVQRDRVVGYIRKGIEEGATLVTGGPDAPEGVGGGYYVQPTVFADVEPSMTIAQEEIFGPVLSILTYTDDDDAVSIANGTVYGLAGGVFGADEDRAVAVARRLRTGQVDVNGGPYNPLAPFGGYKQSGYGRENGRFGLEEFCEVKSLQFRD